MIVNSSLFLRHEDEGLIIAGACGTLLFYMLGACLWSRQYFGCTTQTKIFWQRPKLLGRLPNRSGGLAEGLDLVNELGARKVILLLKPLIRWSDYLLEHCNWCRREVFRDDLCLFNESGSVAPHH